MADNDIIQQITVRENHQITANVARGEQHGALRVVTLANEDV